MGNTASTERRRSPSQRKLLLLSAYALVAYSGISAASHTADGQLIHHVHTLSKTDSKEERVPDIQTVTGVVEKAAMQNKQVVNYIHEQFNRVVSFLAKHPKDEHNAVYAQVADSTLDDVISKFFENFIRPSTGSKDQVQAQALGVLFHQIVFYKTHPEAPVHQQIIPGTPEYEKASLFDQRRSVVLRLETLLLDYWKETPLSEDDFNAILIVDVERNAFFDDAVLLSYIDYLDRNTARQTYSPIHFLLNKLREEERTEVDIATRLLEVDADKKPGSLAYKLLEALENDWLRPPLNSEQLLLELVPSLEDEDLLDGPLKLWIQTFRKKYGNNVYQTVVHTLLDRRDVKQGHMQLNPDEEPMLLPDPAVSALEDNVMSLVTVIAKDWAKRFPKSLDTINLPSPHASPLFDALRIYLPKNRMDVGALLLLHLKKMDKEALPRDYERVYQMLLLRQDKTTSWRSVITGKSEWQYCELLALMVDIDIERYENLSKEQFRQWVEQKKSKKDVFGLLDLPSSVTRLFQDRLLTIWYKYTPDSDVQPFEQIMSMREFLEHRHSFEDFQSELEKAVLTSDGQQQRVLFDLLAISWIESGKRVDDISFFHHPHLDYMKDWFKDLPTPPRKTTYN